ncbi:MAG: Polysaccharide transporter, permease protein [Nitrosarchaeum sp.]|nr:Polysaccharide transporter, permease protein [Nitrosarchaeum sp.]
MNFARRKSIIWDFAVTDLKIRYRKSILGFLWTILEPLLFLSVLYVVFTNVFENKIEYFALYLLLGIIMWNMLVRGTQMGMNGIISRSGLLTKIYIPTSIPGISSTLTALIMFTFEMTVFGVFLVAFQFIPPYTIIIFPLIVILETILIVGLNLPLSVINVRVRDIQFIWNIVLHAGFFLHPVFYKMEILPKEIQNILQFSPMVKILNFAHDAVLYGKLPTVQDSLIAIIGTLFVLGLGYLVFRKFSSRIMEEI